MKLYDYFEEILVKEYSYNNIIIIIILIVNFNYIPIIFIILLILHNNIKYKFKYNYRNYTIYYIIIDIPLYYIIKIKNRKLKK